LGCNIAGAYADALLLLIYLNNWGFRHHRDMPTLRTG